MRKYILFILAILLVGLSYAAVSDINLVKDEKCIEKVVSYVEEEPIFEIVEKTRSKYILEDIYIAENDTYQSMLVEGGEEVYEETEVIGFNTVEKTKIVCEDDSKIEIISDDKSLFLDYLKNEFECTFTSTEAECDSRLDGNGDGVCKSGESCYFVKLVDGCVEITQKNSGGNVITETKSVDGTCVVVKSDETFKDNWDLVGDE